MLINIYIIEYIMLINIYTIEYIMLINISYSVSFPHNMRNRKHKDRNTTRIFMDSMLYYTILRNTGNFF